jgi:phosphohistidine phosphatase SixA
MADRSNSVAPEWLFIMRHAQAVWPHQKTAGPHSRVWQIRRRRSAAPAEVLTPRGQTEAREIGEAFASVLDDLRRASCSVDVTCFWHEHTEAAEATALAFRSAYQQTADAIEAEYGCGPLPLARMEVIGRNMSAYISNPGLWAEDMIKRLTSNDSRPAQGKGALIIGHDPGMSCLLTTLLHHNAPKVGRYRDVPALARAELLCLRSNGRHWRPMWALTPSAEADIAKITEKIKSKMDTAKVFGGFVTAVLTFVVSQYATTTPKTTYWAAVRGASLTALAIAILLYLMTLFWYDRLLMPRRFWRILSGGKEEAPSKVMRRPPSSAVWVLYQNMQRTWRLLFVPATYAAAIGIVGFALGRIEPSTITAIIIFAAAVTILAISGWWGWRSRPILGVED